jgi:dTDP-glucose pyrophosphorylase
VDTEKAALLERIANMGIKIAVCSNSIRQTMKLVLHKKGFLQYIDYYYSNEDVKRPKPASDMYLKAMVDAGVNPTETLVIEDSHIGRTGALNSGATLLAVRNPSDVTWENIGSYLDDSLPKISPKWKSDNLNVVIPMAGLGHSFYKAGYTFPKPLIDINGKTMIQIVMENLNIEANYYFLVDKGSYIKYHLDKYLNILAPNCKVIPVESGIQCDSGAAVTVAQAAHYIDNDNPLLIANADQFLEWNSNEFMYSMLSDTVDGGIATFKSNHPKWSFVTLDEHGFVNRVEEKIPISEIATCGLYYWAKGSDFVKYLMQMLDKGIMTDKQYYIAPVYNEALADGKKIKIFPVKKMWSLGTPEDVEIFRKREV